MVGKYLGFEPSSYILSYLVGAAAAILYLVLVKTGPKGS